MKIFHLHQFFRLPLKVGMTRALLPPDHFVVSEKFVPVMLVIPYPSISKRNVMLSVGRTLKKDTCALFCETRKTENKEKGEEKRKLGKRARSAVQKFC